MDRGDLKRYVAAKVHDPQMIAIQEALYEQFIDDGIDDLKSSGWLLPLEEDESLTLVSDTYKYSVPSDFAYVWRIYESDNDGKYTLEDPQHMWRLGYDGGVPVIQFDARYWAPTAGETLKIIGQKRPVKPTADSTTIEDGFAGFLRMRAEAYAILYLATVPVEESTGELTERRLAVANARITMANILLGRSEQMLSRHPQEFRVWPNSRCVPTR